MSKNPPFPTFQEFKSYISVKGATSGVGGAGRDLSCPYLDIEKKCPDIEEFTQIVLIYGLNFPFKMLF